MNRGTHDIREMRTFERTFNEHSRNYLLEWEKPEMSEQKLTFNITCYPAFQNGRAIMEELHILLTPNKGHK